MFNPPMFHLRQVPHEASVQSLRAFWPDKSTLVLSGYGRLIKEPWWGNWWWNPTGGTYGLWSFEWLVKNGRTLDHLRSWTSPIWGIGSSPSKASQVLQWDGPKREGGCAWPGRHGQATCACVAIHLNNVKYQSTCISMNIYIYIYIYIVYWYNLI